MVNHIISQLFNNLFGVFVLFLTGDNEENFRYHLFYEVFHDQRKYLEYLSLVIKKSMDYTEKDIDKLPTFKGIYKVINYIEDIKIDAYYVKDYTDLLISVAIEEGRNENTVRLLDFDLEYQAIKATKEKLNI